MSWAQNPDKKISFTPGEGISFMLASDVALYKDIQVVRLADSAFIYYSLKRWMPMGRGRAWRMQAWHRTTSEPTKIARLRPLLQLLRRLQKATRCLTSFVDCCVGNTRKTKQQNYTHEYIYACREFVRTIYWQKTCLLKVWIPAFAKVFTKMLAHGLEPEPEPEPESERQGRGREGKKQRQGKGREWKKQL